MKATPITGWGVALIAEERNRQVAKEGYTTEHDDSHTEGELAAAATVYASPYPIKAKSLISGEYVTDIWPWEAHEFKPSGDRIRDLVKAGALIAAEIDRLHRQNDAALARAGKGETR